MNIKEYQELINKTAVYPKEFGLGYCMLGLDGEFGEFLDSLNGQDEKSKIKECGDVWWYLVATIRKEFNVDCSKIFRDSIIPRDILDINYIKQFHNTKSKLSEKVKKTYRDNASIVINDDLLTIFKSLEFNLRCIMYLHNLDYSEVLKTNYNKLIKRRNTNTLHGSGSDREES